MNFANSADKRTFVLKLLLAEALARPGEGPLAPRFSLPRPAPQLVPPPKERAQEESGE